MGNEETTRPSEAGKFSYEGMIDAASKGAESFETYMKQNQPEMCPAAVALGKFAFDFVIDFFMNAGEKALASGDLKGFMRLLSITAVISDAAELTNKEAEKLNLPELDFSTFHDLVSLYDPVYRCELLQSVTDKLNYPYAENHRLVKAAVDSMPDTLEINEENNVRIF